MDTGRLSLCNWLRSYSAHTWLRLAFAYHHHRRLRLHETTITQMLVFDFWCAARGTKLPIEIYESRDEKSNGNDLEIVLETAKGYLLMPCQAKAIQTGNKYSSIPHEVRGKQQIDLLLNYAKKIKGYPVYMFYNYCSDNTVNRIIQGISGVDIDEYGCSMISADYLKQHYYVSTDKERKHGWEIPTFKDLHINEGVPFHNFICSTDSMLESILRSQYTHQGEALTFYSKEDITEAKAWKNLTPPPSLSGIEIDTSMQNIMDRNISSEFNPKFRIVLSFKKRTGQLYRYT
jgi:hypothetical protein